MYRRIVLFFFILFPLVFILVGYPVSSRVSTDTPFIQSQRCFTVGDTNEFFSCFTKNSRLAGIDLLANIGKMLYATEPIFIGVIMIALFGQIFFIFLLIFFQKEEHTKTEHNSQKQLS